MNKLKKEIKEYAKKLGADIVGIADVERFKNAPLRMSPKGLLPEAKSVIVCGIHHLNASIELGGEPTPHDMGPYVSQSSVMNPKLDDISFLLARFLEDKGYKTLPIVSSNIWRYKGYKDLKVHFAPDIGHRYAAVAGGLGEIGWSKVFLTKKFGPRQRLHAILTDLELEPDPLVRPGSICKKCMECVKDCPSYAIPHIKENKKIKIKIEDYEYEWADIHLGKCTLSYHGGDSRVSPFIHKDFPGWNIDARKQNFDEETAYKFCWTLSTGGWRKTKEFPSGYIIEGHAMIQKWGEGGSYGICGSRGCMRSCFNYLEKNNIIEQRFKNGDFIKRKRWILPYKVKNGKNKG
jgi:epoxyqueuosine reductase